MGDRLAKRIGLSFSLTNLTGDRPPSIGTDKSACGRLFRGLVRMTRHTENGLARAPAAPPLYDLPTLRPERLPSLAQTADAVARRFIV
jgi:hypothetical protein